MAAEATVTTEVLQTNHKLTSFALPYLSQQLLNIFWVTEQIYRVTEHLLGVSHSVLQVLWRPDTKSGI